MKRTLITAGLLLALAGCSKTVYVNDTTPPDTTEKKQTTTDAPIATPAPTLPPTTWTAEDEFLFDIKNTVYVAVSDYDLLETGYIVCDALRSGATVTDLAIAITSVGYEQELLAAVAASAALNLCPDQAWKFN